MKQRQCGGSQRSHRFIVTNSLCLFFTVIALAFLQQMEKANSRPVSSTGSHPASLRDRSIYFAFRSCKI
jgi:hypothetical protein